MTSEVSETLQKVVNEGLNARNLLNFISDGSNEGDLLTTKPPLSPRPQSASPKPIMEEEPKWPIHPQLKMSHKRRNALSRPKNRLRSASAGRNPEKDLRTRYWTFLFENLHRAVDEIYQTCEMDESIVESKEAIMMLENYSKDFHALIQYININKNYERTAPTNRPTSLAWEVRKSSPGKSLLKNVFIERLAKGNSDAKRILCFDAPNEFAPTSEFKPFNSIGDPNKEAHTKSNTGLQDKNPVTDSQSQTDNMSKNYTDVKLPLISDPEESFPCNDNLVVNEVHCHGNSVERESVIEESKKMSSSEKKTNSPVKSAESDTKQHGILKSKPTSSVKDDSSEASSVTAGKSVVAKVKTGVTRNTKRSTVGSVSAKTSKQVSINDSVEGDSPTKTATAISKTSKVDLKRSVSNLESHTGKTASETKTKKMNTGETRDKLQKKIETETTSQNTKDASPKSAKPHDTVRKGLEDKNVAIKQPAQNVSNSPAQQKVSLSSKSESKPSCENLSPRQENSVSKTRPGISNTAADVKKQVKITSNASAIQRNISYVQSLSSKNQMEKSQTVKTPQNILRRSSKLSKKSDSMTSLSRPSSARTMARKTASVEKIPEILKCNPDEDSDGWETVRSRNRCRNSPVKKIPFPPPESQAVQFAKLSQSRIGGFPYTTKVNGKSTKTPQKDPQKKATTPADKTQKKKTNETKDGGKQKTSKNIPMAEKSVSKESLTDRKPNDKKCKVMESLKLPDHVLSAFETNIFPTRIVPGHRSSSITDLRTDQDEQFRDFATLSKVLCISDQSLSTQKYININMFKKKISESSSKRKHKKVRISTVVEGVTLNSSLEESDNGLTSDDQDGTMSHDEAFDENCQELYDAAWKYKIIEKQVHKLELSYGEQMDLMDMELRTPGRAFEMHEKLSSPFRKKSIFESIRLCNEKQVKAQEQRERLSEQKAQKFKILEEKRQQMKTICEMRLTKQRVFHQEKLQRAEEKRKKQLDIIIKKAHDEEEKVNEIAFINTLEAQNKRHELISKEKDHEARLHDIQEERQRKLDEKAAKEAAAEGRRKILEAERQARLNEMQEKRKIKEHKVEQLFQVKEKERQELANQKARERELRLSALNAQQQNTIEELQKKIQLKQEESARRHEENIEQIRQKAFELSVRKCSSNNDDVPQPLPYETKKICTICNVLIGSEVYLLSHLHGKKHQEAVKLQYQGNDPSTEELELYNLKHIVDASTDQLDPNIAMDKERQKAFKKRCKKLRLRMTTRGQEYESQILKDAESANSTHKTKMSKIASDIQKLYALVEENNSDASILPNLERTFNELVIFFQKKLHQDKTALKATGGMSAAIHIVIIASRMHLKEAIFHFKKFLSLCHTFIMSVIINSYDICKYILLSNKIGNMLDALMHCMNDLVPDTVGQGKPSSSCLSVNAGKMLHLLTIIFVTLSSETITTVGKGDKENKADDFHLRIQDMISYIVSIGIVDKISQLFTYIQGPITDDDETLTFLKNCVQFLTALVQLNSDCFQQNPKTEDLTQLIATFRVTNMVGIVSLLYSLLLQSGAPSRGEETPVPLPKQIEGLALSILVMLNNMAITNLQVFQSILGSEGLSLQLRHTTSYLLWYCSHVTAESLLHEVILLVGYFTVLNPENQSIIQAGQRPTVLQQLCCLPFLYFSDTELTDILFPTLISCCYNNEANKTILQQEMTSELLSNYIEVKYLNIEESSLTRGKSSDQTRKWLFGVRFPKCNWSSARNYFSEE